MATLPFVQELANLVGEAGSSKFFIDDGNLSAPFTKMLEALDFVFDEGPIIVYVYCVYCVIVVECMRERSRVLTYYFRDNWSNAS